MRQRELEEMVRRAYEAFNSRDSERALAFFHETIEIDSSAAFVRHGPYRGLEGVREFYASIDAVYDEFTLEPEEVFPLPGDRVLVVARVRSRERGGELTVDALEGDLWTLRDGRAARLEVFPDVEEARALAEVESKSG